MADVGMVPIVADSIETKTMRLQICLKLSEPGQETKASHPLRRILRAAALERIA